MAVSWPAGLLPQSAPYRMVNSCPDR